MDFTALLKTVAPAIGTALLGPLAVPAMAVLQSVFGLSDSTTATIKTAIAGATPEQLLALKQADQDFQIKMKQIGFADVEALAALNVQNTEGARAMQTATKSWIPGALAVTVTVGLFTLLGGMLSGYLKVSDNQSLLILLGALSAAFGNVINYYFGDSAGHSQTTELLAQAPSIK